jgi:hypothetical protein
MSFPALLALPVKRVKHASELCAVHKDGIVLYLCIML